MVNMSRCSLLRLFAWGGFAEDKRLRDADARVVRPYGEGNQSVGSKYLRFGLNYCF